MLKEQILKSLSTGHFVSGEELGEKFNVTRSAIAKHIKAINDMGLEVYSVKGKGYKLANPLQLLDQQVIDKTLHKLNCHSHVEVQSIIDSTNSFLLRKLPNNITHGDVCLAEYQSQGRGRRGREWVSPFGSHLYLSMYCAIEQGISAAMGLSVAVALAISDTIKTLSDNQVELKWPNDIYWQGKKLAGILIELEGQPLEPSHAVIGIGLNVNMPEDSALKIDQPWSAVNHFMPEIDRSYLAAHLISALRLRLDEHAKNGLRTMVEQWNIADCYLNKPIKIISANKELKGINRGIDHNGALLLEVNGVKQTIYGGEVSLRSQ